MGSDSHDSPRVEEWPISRALSARLQRLGFDSGLPIYGVEPFPFEEITECLLDTSSQRRQLLLANAGRGKDYWLGVDRVQVVLADEDEFGHLGFYVRGHLYDEVIEEGERCYGGPPSTSAPVVHLYYPEGANTTKEPPDPAEQWALVVQVVKTPSGAPEADSLVALVELKSH